MKKIVGILAAAALLATSVFAVDFSGGVRLEGDLFNYNGTTEGASALMLKNANHFWEAPLALSVTTDRVGATVKFTDNDTNAFETGKWAIWFKPMDMLKVNLGTIAKDINLESIEYNNRLFNYDSFGASLDVEIDAFALNIAVVSGNGSYWFNNDKAQKFAGIKKLIDADKKNNADSYKGKTTLEEEWAVFAANLAAELADPSTSAKRKTQIAKDLLAFTADAPDAGLGELNVWGAYTADFGTISAMFDFNNTFKDIKMLAGYKNTFGDLTIFADGMFAMSKANKDADFVNSWGIDADAAYAKDALAAQGYVQVTAPLKDMKKENINVLLLAKVAYTLDQGTVYLKFKDKNLLAEDFAATIRPGFESDLGIMHYEIAAEFDVAKKVNVSIPVNFKVTF